MQDLHYKNVNGEIITIDPRLKPDQTNPGIYHALQQAIPTELNMIEGYTAFKLLDKSVFKFNQKLISYSTNDFITYDNLQVIRRSDYSVGSDGAEIFEAFDQIDQQLIFDDAFIKSNYIVKNSSAFIKSNKFFVIEDAFILPNGYSLQYDLNNGSKNDFGFWNGNIQLINTNGNVLATFESPVIYDNNTSDILLDENRNNVISYVIEQIGNTCKIKLIVETAWLTSPNRIYPVTIDPVVYGETAGWSGIQGTDNHPNFCSNTLSVPTPAAAVLTGSTVYWEFSATGFGCPLSCKMNFLQVKLNTVCGSSPGNDYVWVCGIACNMSGTWMATLDNPLSDTLVKCMLPSCNAYNMDFTLSHNQAQCITMGECITNCAKFINYQVTIEGETITNLETCNGIDDDCDSIIDEEILETVSILSDGPTTFCQGGNVLLTAIYSGATVQWKKDGVNIPGATSSTYNANKKGTYTAETISDCGTATSAGILINIQKNPPASITAGGSTTFCAGGSVVLSANTGAGLSYQWYKGASLIAGATSINYSATLGGNYKCRVTKTATGCFKNSNVINVSVPCKEDNAFIGEDISFSLYPNPASKNFIISADVSSEIENSTIEIYNNIGQLVYSMEINSIDGVINETIDINSLVSGIYLVKLLNESLQLEEMLVIE